MKSIFGVTIGIILIGIVGILYLQNNSIDDPEIIFFTLQGDNTVNSYPNEDN